MPLSLAVYLTVLNRKCYYMGEPDAGLEEYISQTQPKKTTCYREAVSVPVQKTGQNKHYNGWQHYYHLILLK